VIFAILVIGFSGLVAQILLLRELLVSFYGNELTVGVILANWVVLEALGALSFGRLIDRIKNKLAMLVILNILFLVSFPLCIWGVRTFKLIFGLPLGLGVGIGTIFWISLVFSLPISFTHGGLFSSCAKIYAASSQSKGASAGRVYFWETLGTILAGVVFTYFMIPHFNSFQIAGAIAILNTIVCLYLLFEEKTGHLLLKGLSVILLAALLYLFSNAGWNNLHQASIKRQWRNFDVLDYANSIYGNIVVTKRQDQYTFFSNGLPVITTPLPDLVFVEEFANIPLLFHPQPKKILVVSGGAGGVINEILKMPTVSRVDYVELDPLILDMLKAYPTDLTQRELQDERVTTINLDGRFFLNQTDAKYDVIYLGLSEPSDLQSNRLFTKEFFKLVKNRLMPEGILTFTLSGSLTYLSKDLRDLNACILNSLRDVFSCVRVIPGDFNLFLACDSEGMIQVNSSLINQRIQSRNIKVNLLLPRYIDYRLHQRWQDWFYSSFKDATQKSNADFSGFALFKTLSIWNAKFSPSLGGIFCILEKISLGSLISFIFGLTLIFLIIKSVHPRFSRFAIPYSIATTGFFGMLINLVIIFAFQAVYGYLYFQIGMLIAVFMSGAALGSLLLSHYLERVKRNLGLFASLEIAVILSVFIILFLILSGPSRFIFFVLCFISGFWTGTQFPLANKMYLNVKSQNFGTSVGLIYSADLFGGWLAGILSGILFLPLLGLVNTCIVISGLKLSSLIFLLLSRKAISN
jgi:spermidine synthase